MEKRSGKFLKVAFEDKNALRRIANPHDDSNVWRTAFIRDVDKILNCPFYNRYTDKTQVFSLYKNDDIAHRGLHVQLVSRIARTIGEALNLNLNLIEAIALGHDLGHTPFGHMGEQFLDKLSFESSGKHFAHNIHSVRVVDKIFPLNVTLQTLDGIACHNGEMELKEYAPQKEKTFSSFDKEIQECYIDSNKNKLLTPSTLEGCVVRISDIIAYLGKDRQDAERSKLSLKTFVDYGIGTINSEIINNLIVNIIENSYGKPYIKMDELHFNALKKCKEENYNFIYKNPEIKKIEVAVSDMMCKIYEKLLDDLKNERKSSPVFTHHFATICKSYYKHTLPYEKEDKNQIVIDYIASMTDDYFVELYNYLFPSSSLDIKYNGYFD